MTRPLLDAASPFLFSGNYCCIPSTMNERDFVDLARISLTFFWSADAFQACAFSALSNAMMIMRFGGVPSRGVILSVRVR